MSKTTLLLPLPNKSAEPKVSAIFPSSFQFARLINANQILKELLLLAFCKAKSSID